MKVGSILLLLILLLTVLPTSADSLHPDPASNDHSQGTPQDSSGSAGRMGNMQSNDPIYEHGEELPFDHGSYLKHVDTDKDGFVTFEEHQVFFKQYILGHESSHEEWQQRIKDYYDHLDKDKNGRLTGQQYLALFIAPAQEDEL